MLDRPHLDLVALLAPEVQGDRLAIRGALQNVNASRGVEDITTGHGSVGATFLGEYLSDRPVPDHLGQRFPPCPPLG